jgi:hypothetical protein
VTHSRNALTLNALRIQQFSSQRRPGEFSRSESPTRQGEAPVYPDASVSSLDHPAGIITAEMIVMVMQPHPARGKVARWHCVPGDADLLPADVSPFSGDIIFNSLVAYPMGAGRTRIAPGKQAGKDGGKTDVEKRCGYLAFATLLVEILFYFFLVDNAENDCAKNWKAMSSLTSPGRRQQRSTHLALLYLKLFCCFFRARSCPANPTLSKRYATKRFLC